ncbi:sensor domain-containing diguanylate cyclase [Leucothrix sargassi]|nr:sensor domain-containing diguanylate cyclase [Leucothrix sargassi]
MLKDMRITLKFPLVMITFALISALTTGAVAYLQAANSIKSQAKDHLYSLLESRESSLEHYIQAKTNSIQYHANSALIRDAFKEFSNAWSELPETPQQYLTSHYLSDNPYPAAQRQYLLAAKDGSKYSSVHEKYHPEFTSLIATGAFYDLFLLDTSGNVIYTVTKESDFATNLNDDAWSKTGLAMAFQKAAANPAENKLHFIDFSPYAPSNDDMASFVSIAVLNEQGKLSGILGFQLSIDKLNQVMQVTAGMGESGETYLVGPDLTMRSDSRFFSTSTILKTTVNTVPVQKAFKGESSVIIADDYRGISVYSAFKSFNLFGEQWAILAEKDESEVHAPIVSLNHLLIITGFIIGLLIAALGYFLSSDLATPIRSMTRSMNKLSKNDLSTNISVDERRDEVGLMADALIKFKRVALEKEKLKEELVYMAKHDSLTGLPNREFIMPILKERTDIDNFKSSGITIMYADLDGFKAVNDVYGHAFGDEVLRQVSVVIVESLRENDLVSRIGGDEFLIIFPDDTTKEDCEKIAARMIKRVGEINSIADRHVSLGISLGSANFPNDAADTRELMRMADEAMYIAKSQGKNCYITYNELTEHTSIEA